MIQFVDSCKTHEDFFIITDFYNGGTLTKIITKEILLTDEQVQFLGKQMLEAQKALFDDLNAIHRDIKPDNYLLHMPKYEEGKMVEYSSAEELFKNEIRLILCDFGIAKVLIDEDVAETVAGTRLYWAPERWEQEEYGIKSEMWALVCILFELAHGRTPFPGNKGVSVYKTALMKGNVYLDKDRDYSLEFLHLLAHSLTMNI